MMRPFRIRIKRLIFLLLAFAVGGAIVNVAVAWGCAIGLNCTVGNSSVLQRVSANGTWTAQITSRAGACVYVLIRGDKNATTRIGLGHAPDDLLPLCCKTVFESRVETKEASHEYRKIDTRGWPFASMWSERLQWLATAGSANIEVVMGGIPYVTPVRTPGIISYDEDARAIPLRIIRPGFAINTIFYMAILWLLFSAPFALRRRLRERRGQCPSCAYPVGSSNVCTECGTAVTPQRR
jgi:hypothetical protein